MEQNDGAETRGNLLTPRFRPRAHTTYLKAECDWEYLRDFSQC